MNSGAFNGIAYNGAPPAAVAGASGASTPDPRRATTSRVGPDPARATSARTGPDPSRTTTVRL